MATSKLGMMRGTNLLSSEIDFRTSSGASTSVQFDEDFAPSLFDGAAYVKGLYITSWETTITDGGIKIQDGSSTAQASNTDIIICDISTASSPANIAKQFTFSGGLQIATGLHIAATADFGANSNVKVRVLYEPVGGAGAAASINLASHGQANMLVSAEMSFTDGAAGSSQFDEAFSVKIDDNPTLLHGLIITEWTGVNIATDVNLKIQNGSSTTVASNTDLINLSITTGTVGENMQKNWDFPGGIYFDAGLHIASSADLGGDNIVKFRAIYERV